jgi:osmoprotectant transport system ATP-binding protein
VNTSAVAFHGVSASRGGRSVLHDVTLTIGGRETVALVGRSGSGKTTLLRLVNRLLEPDAGRVVVDERDVRAWDPIALRRRIGYAIQDAGLFPHMTVAGNIATVPSLLNWDAARIAARVDELLALVGLNPAEYRTRPLLLMDEPFGALDPITKAELHVEFRRVQAAMHRAVILVTHDIREAMALADRVAVLHQGRIIACATGAELQHSSDPRVTALIST